MPLRSLQPWRLLGDVCIMVKIGEYTISNPEFSLDGKKSLWIKHETGEGMTVDEDKFVGFIDELWSDF